MRWARVSDRIWLSLLLLLAGALRFYQIGQRSLWFDEAITALTVRYNVAQILTQRLDPMLPPAYFLLLHIWQRAWGWPTVAATETLLRSFSVLWSMAAILAVYAVGRQMFDRRVGLLAAGLFVISPFQIAYAQEARFYSLVVFCGAILLWLFARALADDRARHWVMLAAAAAIGLYVNYLLALLVAAFHVYACCLPQRRRWLTRLLLMDAGLMLSLLPLAADLLQQSQQLSTAYRLTPPTVLAPLVTLAFLQFGYVTDSPVRAGLALAITLTLWLLLTVSLIRRRVWHNGDGRQLLWLVMMAPPALMLGLSLLIQPVYYDRWFAFAAPALAVFLAQGVTARSSGLYRVLMILLVAVSLWQVVTNFALPDAARPPFREMSAHIVNQAQPADVVFHLHDSTFPSFRHYAPELHAYLWQDDAGGWLVPTAWKWFGERTHDLAQLLDHYSRVWVIYPQIPLDQTRQGLVDYIAVRRSLIARAEFESIRVDLYATP